MSAGDPDTFVRLALAGGIVFVLLAIGIESFRLAVARPRRRSPHWLYFVLAGVAVALTLLLVEV